jgi:hypothetical protein
MNTWRVCAAIGLGMSLAIAAGCSSSSSPGKNDGGGSRDTNRDTSIGNRDTGAACTANGQTYQPGESFTNNCVRYTCVSGTNFTVSGSPCVDAITPTNDTRTVNDLSSGPEAGRADAGDAAGNRDVSPVETARQDTVRPVDVEPTDVQPREDVARPGPEVEPGVDLGPPGPDVTQDLPPPVQCTYGGQKYGAGVSFPCDCNTCKCDNTGTIVAVTSNDCTIDAGP